MVTAGELYNNLRSRLKTAGTEDYTFEARCMIEQALGIRFEKILVNRDMEISRKQLDIIEKMVQQREKGFPLQYILGEWEFYGLDFKVGTGVLIPRADTETLTDYALEEARENPCGQVIDLCSGTGCIAIAVEKNIEKPCSVYAVEKSEKAFEYLLENIKINDSEVKPVKADVLCPETARQYKDIDMIVSNPPYLTENDMNNLQKEVTFEPETALRGGFDGLDFYRRITELWKDSLKKGGIIAFEIGINQENDVSEILITNNFDKIQYKRDLNGVIRVVGARKI